MTTQKIRGSVITATSDRTQSNQWLLKPSSWKVVTCNIALMGKCDFHLNQHSAPPPPCLSQLVWISWSHTSEIRLFYNLFRLSDSTSMKPCFFQKVYNQLSHISNNALFKLANAKYLYLISSHQQSSSGGQHVSNINGLRLRVFE
jgi:hypothetical protein